MIAMVQRFLRQKFESPLVSVTLAVLALLVGSPPALSNGPARLVALLLIASGAVSRDASSGALQIILARPISRTEYLGGRLFGVMAAYAIFLAAATIFALLLSLRFGGTATLLSPALPRALAGALLDGLQVAVLLLFFSTFLPSYADALGYVLLWVAFSTASAFGTALGNAGLAKAAHTAQENLLRTGGDIRQIIGIDAGRPESGEGDLHDPRARRPQTTPTHAGRGHGARRHQEDVRGGRPARQCD